MSTKPIYTHDCEACLFLGTHHKSDLYYCEGGMPTVVARFGNEGSEYTSGVELAKHDPRLAEAKRRALECGFIGDRA